MIVRSLISDQARTSTSSCRIEYTKIAMAVLIEGLSVVVRVQVIQGKFPGGWEAFERIVPNQTLCVDTEIARVGFMVADDVKRFVEKLQAAGLVFVEGRKAVDFAVVDQQRGLTTECDWAESGHVKVGSRPRDEVRVCALIGSQLQNVVAPDGWRYEGSLSQSFAFVPKEHIQKGPKFLRRENSLDVYLDPLTGKEIFVGRADGKP